MNQLLNPVTILGGMTQNNNPWGKNQYDAMLVKVEHRFSKGFSVINSFTWSKLFEDTSWTGPEIAGRNVEHKLGGEDRPFRLSDRADLEDPDRPQAAARQEYAEGAGRGRGRLEDVRPVHHSVRRAGGLQHRLVLQRQEFRAAAATSRASTSGSTRRSSIRFPDEEHATSRPIRPGPACRTCPATTTNRRPAMPSRTASTRTSPPTSATTRRAGADVRASRTNNVDAGHLKNFVDPREGCECSSGSRPTTCSTIVRFGAPEQPIRPAPVSARWSRSQQNNSRLVQMALKLYY